MRVYNLKVVASILIISLFVGACGSERLNPLERRVQFAPAEFATSKFNFCTSMPTKLKSYIKMTLVIDKSGSNFQDFDSNDNPLPGTDPQGKRRYDSAIAFINSLPNDPSDPTTYYFRLVNFSDAASDVLNKYISDRTQFTNLLKTERDKLGVNMPQDGGWTNYQAAAATLATIVSKDIDNARKQGDNTTTSYVNFMFSDGAPITASGIQDQAIINNQVQTMVALQASNRDFVDAITLNTGYYYNVGDPLAINRLQSMASVGKGQFYEFSVGQAIDFSKFSLPVRAIRRVYSDIFVHNKNVVWSKDSILEVSTAGDGLPDSLKVDPTKADEDKNGVQDLVEYLLTGKACRDSQCAPAPRGQDYSLKCSSVANANPTGPQDLYKTAFRGGLNSCEELALGGNPNTWHTNDSPVPDSLLVRFFLPIGQGSSSADRQPFSDGLSNYEKVKLNVPTMISMDKISGLIPQTYNIELVSSTPTQDCYRGTVENIPIFRTNNAGNSIENNIQIWLVEADSVITGKYYLRYGEKQVSGTSVEFSDSDLY